MLFRSGKAVIDQLPFGISKVGSITHPQGNRGMYIQFLLVMSAFRISKWSFQTRSKVAAIHREPFQAEPLGHVCDELGIEVCAPPAIRSSRFKKRHEHRAAATLAGLFTVAVPI